MKTSLFILLACILPLLLSGINPHLKQYSHEQNQDLLSPFRNLSPEIVAGQSLLPVKPVDRERNWRLTECLFYYDLYENGLMVELGKDVIYYNQVNPACIDSIVYFYKDIETDVYLRSGSREYYYDASGELIVRVDYHGNSNHQETFSKHLFEYDGQNRLLYIYYYETDYDSGELFVNMAANFVYDNNRLLEVNQRNSPTGQGPYHWYKQTFVHDEQGRVINRLLEVSADSLNWSTQQDYTNAYNLNDTSTGNDFIHYWSHDFAVGLDDAYCDLDMVGMPSETVYRLWDGADWNNDLRYTFTYDNANRLINKTSYSWLDIWNPADLYSVFYDNNNNLQRISYQTWNDSTNVWNSIATSNTFLWEQMTANEDEIAPDVALSISVYPNPFKEGISLNLNSKDNAPYEASIYNVKGQLIKQFSKQQSKSLVWDGKDNANKLVGNGIYFIKVNQTGRSITQKLIHIK